MKRKLVRARDGFTLIELMVAVAIIALLISILLPSLRNAREQGKVAQCLMNYHQLMLATTQYFLDFNDSFPFGARSAGGSIGICNWSYGGKTNDDPDWVGGPHYIPIEQRPFNPYLMSSTVLRDLYVGGQLVRKTEVPVLKCPSDRMSNQNRFDHPQQDPKAMPTYEYVGTSYLYNLHALMDTNIDPWGPPGNQGCNWQVIGRAVVRECLAKFSGLYVMFLEDPMDYGLEHHSQEIGNHGRFGKNSVAFLDGHAEYKATDTRRYCGLGWAGIVPSWRFAGLKNPPIYYVPSADRKNCDP